MPTTVSNVVPFLWYAREAEEAGPREGAGLFTCRMCGEAAEHPRREDVTGYIELRGASPHASPAWPLHKKIARTIGDYSPCAHF